MLANILLPLKKKNKLDNSFNDEEEKSSKGENKGDKDNEFKANVKKNGKEWGEGNVGVYVWKMPAAKQNSINIAAEQCGVDDCEGELEGNSKATININYHECKIAEDTKNYIGIMFNLESNEVQVSLRNV